LPLIDFGLLHEAIKKYRFTLCRTEDAGDNKKAAKKACITWVITALFATSENLIWYDKRLEKYIDVGFAIPKVKTFFHRRNHI
jgi:hypothetical protein